MSEHVQPSTDVGPASSAQAGIGRKSQKPTVFERHSVFENLELAMRNDKRVRSTLRAKLACADLDRIAETLALIQLDDAADREAGLLSHGQKQWLEIGMLLVREPRLLLLDEPLAGMTDDETMRTAELRQTLAGRHAVVFVEHDMAASLCDAFLVRLSACRTALPAGQFAPRKGMSTIRIRQAGSRRQMVARASSLARDPSIGALNIGTRHEGTVSSGSASSRRFQSVQSTYHRPSRPRPATHTHVGAASNGTAAVATGSAPMPQAMATAKRNGSLRGMFGIGSSGDGNRRAYRISRTRAFPAAFGI